MPEQALTLPDKRETFAEAILAAHKAYGGSWEEFARIFGMSDKAVLGWRRGTIPREHRLVEALEKAGRVISSEITTRIYNAYERRRSYHIDTSVTNFRRGDIDVNVWPNQNGNAAVHLAYISPEQPEAPVQTTSGPTLTATNDGFDIQPRQLSESERSNPGQISLHKRLKTMVDRLQASMPGLSNTHPALAEEFGDYRTFLATDMADLDVTSLWSVGAGLGEFVRALDQASATAMTPELEPDVAAGLRTLMKTHTVFIVGFSEGVELLERAAKVRQASESDPQLQDKTEAVLRPMEREPRLLAVKAVKIVRSLLRGFRATPTVALDTLTSGGEIARSGVYAFIKVLHPIILASEAVGFVSVMAGHNNPEVMHAAAAFLRDHGSQVAALFAHDQQVEEWLAWAIAKLHGFELD